VELRTQLSETALEPIGGELVILSEHVDESFRGIRTEFRAERGRDGHHLHERLLPCIRLDDDGIVGGFCQQAVLNTGGSQHRRAA
jgi:hypothetical protein